MTFKFSSYFRCVRPECSQTSYRPGLCNPVNYRCSYCGGELMNDRSLNKSQPKVTDVIPLAVSRNSVIVQTITPSVIRNTDH